MTVRCGQCIGCRLAYSREWACRMTHEAQLHPTNCTLTLTYNAENMPALGSLEPSHHQSFIHELRRKTGKRIRYFHCGEYGEGEKRPHFHTCLFGYDFPDKQYWGSSKSGLPLYRSPILESVWDKGFSYIGSLSFSSAQYVAKYATKSINVSRGSSEAARKAYGNRYDRLDPSTGELVQVHPEYVTMSRRPGIGYDWFFKFKSDLYPHDFAVVEGKKMPVPKYYDRLLEEHFPEEFKAVKAARRQNVDRSDREPDRLRALEVCAQAKNNFHGVRT